MNRPIIHCSSNAQHIVNQVYSLICSPVNHTMAVNSNKSSTNIKESCTHPITRPPAKCRKMVLPQASPSPKLCQSMVLNNQQQNYNPTSISWSHYRILFIQQKTKLKLQFHGKIKLSVIERVQKTIETKNLVKNLFIYKNFFI